MSAPTASVVVKATATALKAMDETASSIMWNKSGIKQGIATTHLSLLFCVFIYIEFVVAVKSKYVFFFLFINTNPHSQCYYS
jgi:hypothetical protein